jgi:hypothetical protein
MAAVTAIPHPCYFPVTSLFAPCSECNKSAAAMAAKSSEGLSLLVFAVIGKPTGLRKRAICPVFFPVSWKSEEDIFAVTENKDQQTEPSL